MKYNTTHHNLDYRICLDSSAIIKIINTHTDPEELREAAPVISHGEVVRLGPQDLHNVLVKLSLLILQKELIHEINKE